MTMKRSGEGRGNAGGGGGGGEFDLSHILGTTSALHGSLRTKRDTEGRAVHYTKGDLFEPHELAVEQQARERKRVNTNSAPDQPKHPRNRCQLCGGHMSYGGNDDCLSCDECGTCGIQVISEDAEWRTFGDDTAADKAKKQRTSYDNRDEKLAWCTITEREVPLEEVRVRAHNRLNQMLVWLGWLRWPGVPCHLALTDDECNTFQMVARQVCIKFAEKLTEDDGAAVDRQKGSPVFWAVGLALAIAARRPGGFNVQTKEMQKNFTMKAVHDRLWSFKGNAKYTEEVVTNRTKANAKGVDDAKRALEKAKIRLARFDELGSDTNKKVKLRYLTMLIIRSKVWGELPTVKYGEEGDRRLLYKVGIAKEVLQLQGPGLLPRFPSKRRVEGYSNAALRRQRERDSREAEEREALEAVAQAERAERADRGVEGELVLEEPPEDFDPFGEHEEGEEG
ncbi:MAG: hypothetical protein ACKVI4_17500, partial [Actinomycetales bacterium]